MSTDRHRVSALPLGMATLGLDTQKLAWQPNWIDYRHSLVVIDLRRDKGEEPETCDDCHCEIDIDPAPHSPKCKVKPAAAPVRRPARAAVDGLELLERMDAGESVAMDEEDEPVELKGGLEETPDIVVVADRGAAVTADDAGVSSNPRRAHRGRGELLAEVLEVLAAGPMRLNEIAERCGYTSQNLGGWIIPHVKAGRIVKVERGVYALPQDSEREPPAGRRAGAESAAASASGTDADETGHGQSPPSRSEHNAGRRHAWEKDDIIEAIRRWDAEYGHPPTSTEWMRRVDGYPTTSTVAARFGSWANAIEQSGFARPTCGGVPLRHAFEARSSGSGASSEVQKPEEVPVELEIPRFHRALVVAAIAAMRAAADALEQELGSDA